jgi:hypothetical protein
MSAATWEQLSTSSNFGGAELTMELVSPGRMKTGPVQRSIKSIKGPNQMKKWRCQPTENKQLGKQRMRQLITDVVAWTEAGIMEPWHLVK